LSKGNLDETSELNRGMCRAQCLNKELQDERIYRIMATLPDWLETFAFAFMFPSAL